MKIAIPVAKSNGLESEIYGHFGSAPFFAIIESDNRIPQFVPNSNAEHMHGTCNPIMALADNQVDAVIVKGIGRNAFSRLNSAGIRVYTSGADTIGIAVDDLLSGKLREFDINLTCEGHSM